MDHAAVLALIAELYGSVSRLTAENQALREQLTASGTETGRPVARKEADA